MLGVGVGIAYLALQVGSGFFNTVWLATFGSALGLSQVIQLATPLILAGSAVAIAQRAGLWNIGVEGQLFIGAWAGTAVAFALPGLPSGLLVVCTLLGALAGGAVWAVVPALGRTRLGVSEVISTLMLNFVAYLWLAYWATGPWASPGTGTGGGLYSKPLPAGVSLPTFSVGAVQIGVGFLVAVAVALSVALLFRSTRLGVRTRLVGAGGRTASYAGINAPRVQFSVFLLSGAIGGLVGIVVELDHVHSYASTISSNTGYVGIVVALLAAASLAEVPITGFFIALLVAVGGALQIDGVSSSVVLLLTGVVLLFASFSPVLARYSIRVSGRSGRPRHTPADDEVALSASDAVST
jgi:simple sugar transport system permease protein